MLKPNKKCILPYLNNHCNSHLSTIRHGSLKRCFICKFPKSQKENQTKNSKLKEKDTMKTVTHYLTSVSSYFGPCYIPPMNTVYHGSCSARALSIYSRWVYSSCGFSGTLATVIYLIWKHLVSFVNDKTMSLFS